MARYDGTPITTNATRQLVGNISAQRCPDSGIRTINARGTFGGGAVTFELTNDDINFETILDPVTNTTASFTATRSLDIFVGAPASGPGKFLRLYATMTGGTAQNVIPSFGDTRA